MFRHLKAEDFVNLMEGSELPATQRSHITACSRCRATWESVRSMHAEVSSVEPDVPEPDWLQFRSSVRDELLSRSIQRESAVWRWTGWAGRPALAWALSLIFAVGLTTVTVVWKTGRPAPQPNVTPAEVVAVEAVGAVPEKALFDDVVSLGDEQQERLQQMLESAVNGSSHRQ